MKEKLETLFGAKLNNEDLSPNTIETIKNYATTLSQLSPETREVFAGIVQLKFPELQGIMPEGLSDHEAEQWAIGSGLNPFEIQLIWLFEGRERIKPDSSGDLTGDQALFQIPMAKAIGMFNPDK